MPTSHYYIYFFFVLLSYRHFSSSFSIRMVAGVRSHWLQYADAEHTIRCFNALILAFSCIFFLCNLTSTAVYCFFCWYRWFNAWPMVLRSWYAAASAVAAYLAAIYFAIFSFIYCVAMAEREPYISLFIFMAFFLHRSFHCDSLCCRSSGFCGIFFFFPSVFITNT